MAAKVIRGNTASVLNQPSLFVSVPLIKIAGLEVTNSWQLFGKTCGENPRTESRLFADGFPHRQRVSTTINRCGRLGIWRISVSQAEFHLPGRAGAQEVGQKRTGIRTQYATQAVIIAVTGINVRRCRASHVFRIADCTSAVVALRRWRNTRSVSVLPFSNAFSLHSSGPQNGNLMGCRGLSDTLPTQVVLSEGSLHQRQSVNIPIVNSVGLFSVSNKLANQSLVMRALFNGREVRRTVQHRLE